MVSYDVFLSYARADAPRAALIRDKLESAGLSVFFDAEGIDSGEEFPVVIDRAVKGARCVLGLWSRAALERRWVRIESRIGLDQNKLVAAVLDGTRPEDLPAEFYNVNFDSLASFTGQDDHAGWTRVLRAIGRRVGRKELGATAARPTPGISASAPAAAGVSNNRLWLFGAGAAALALFVFVLAPKDKPALQPQAAAASSNELAIPVPYGAPRAQHDVTGHWVGEYWGPDAVRTSFEMDLRGSGQFQGTLIEANNFVIGAGAQLTATIAGEVQDDGALMFRKTYDAANGFSHTVEYIGELETGNTITGTWQVGTNAGEFRMHRR